MNGWLWAATALIAGLAPLLWVAVRRPPIEGLVALEVASTLAAAALLVLAEGTNRQAFADLALVLGVVSFVSSIAFLRFLEQAD